MKKYWSLSTLVFFLLSCAAFANTQNENTLSESTKTISVLREQPNFTIHLKTTPGTGYSWYLTQYDSRFLKLDGHEIAKNTNMPGASNSETWRFKVDSSAFDAPHLLKVDLTYARPWNVNDSPKHISFTIATH